MRAKRLTVRTVVVCLFLAISLRAAQRDPAPTVRSLPAAAESEASVPRLIRFSGVFQNLAGKPIAGPVDVTFSLYADEAGGSPLWFETQTVQADSLGHYTVLLGAMTPAGVPMELFTSGEAHWLGVQVSNLPEQSRVLLVSVPYAMKAGDAETLAGRPASEYQLTPDATSSSDSAARGTAKKGTTTSRDGKRSTKNAESPVTNAFTQNYFPVFADNAGNLTNSIMVQSGIKVGVNTNAPAFSLDVNGAVFAVGPKAAAPGQGGTMRFRDDTGTVRWLFGLPGSAGSQDFFMYNYANGHAPLFIQNGAASYSLYMNNNGNVGIGTTSPAAKLDVAGNLNIPPTASGGATGVISMAGQRFIHACCGSSNNTFVGLNAGNFSTTGAGNTAVGSGALPANTTGATNTAVGQNALNHNATGWSNTALGWIALQNNTADGNTAIGAGALNGNTTGFSNTAVGYPALTSNTTGNYNTAVGSDALNYTTTGGTNTAVGSFALQHTTGNSNTAVGMTAGTDNTSGSYNTAVGTYALSSNTTGFTNVALGYLALGSNTTSSSNTAVGSEALADSIGGENTAVGGSALLNNTTGVGNTGLGRQALNNNTTGASNIAIGYLAGTNATTGSNNIYIGNQGVAAEGATLRIGSSNQTKTFIAGIRSVTTGSANAVQVLIDSAGQLGTVSSSRRFKEDIRDMAGASQRLMRLHPVAFRYRQPSADGSKPLQYGLIAEEVAQDFPELVAYGADGQPETVKYHVLPALLLNELQRQEAKLAEKDREIVALTQQVKELSEVRQQMSALQARLATLEAQAPYVHKKIAGSRVPKTSRPGRAEITRVKF